MGGGYTKREIIDAVTDALRPLGVQGGGYVRQLEAHTADGGGKSPLDDTLRLPAVLVSYSSSTYSSGQYMHLRETVGFEVTVVLLDGSGHDAGKLLGDIRSILAGSSLGLDIGPVMPIRETLLQQDGHRSAYSALYSVTQEVPIAG